jgi:hypothetical protein
MSLIKITEEGIEIDGVILKDTVDLKAFLSAHQPEHLDVSVSAHQPYPFDVYIQPVPRGSVVGEQRSFSAIIEGARPASLNALISSHSPAPLYTYINPMYVHSFKAWFFTVEQGLVDLRLYLKVVREAGIGLPVYLHIWSLGVFSINISTSSGPRDFQAYLWAWQVSDIRVVIETTHPPPLEIALLPQPEPGQDLKIYHGFYKFSNIQIDFNVWTEMYNLRTYLWGLYAAELGAEFTMGSYHPLIVPLPGTSGYRNLFVTCRPASRIMTTLIPVYTIESRNLYISINQGWPCGFGSSYKLLTIEFDYAYLLAFTAVFKVIDGTAADLFGVFINRAYFDTYINKFDIHINIPTEVSEPDTKILDRVAVVYDNEFADLYQDIVQITFNWPRIRLWSGASNFSVELLAYRGDKLYELSVVLYAQRQDPVRQLTSRPLMVKENAFADPVWPDVFQVLEIELWGDDPPEVVRKIEIKFEEQVHEYYWVSSEQRAVSKKVWEQWSFLTRGYLPSAEYSGQIDYLTMRTLSSMKFYDTIDQAVKAMIANFLYSGKTSLRVSCSPHGGYSRLLINMNIWDSGMLKILKVNLEPMHTQTLAINLTAT